jgi:hypothetical protein
MTIFALHFFSLNKIAEIGRKLLVFEIFNRFKNQKIITLLVPNYLFKKVMVAIVANIYYN